jgi:hypothetical protein
MCLLKKLNPDFTTSADVRKDKLAALRAVCRAFTLRWKDLSDAGRPGRHRWPQVSGRD